jgi:hypothetical protein
LLATLYDPSTLYDPWTVLTFRELMPQMIEWLRRLVHEPLCGS